MAISGELLPVTGGQGAMWPLSIQDILASAYQTWHPETLTLLDDVKLRAMRLREQRRSTIRQVRAGQLESLL
jgi:hypothetical protein